MAAVTLTPEDLAPFATIDEAKAQEMIVDAIALAARVAPCIVDDDFEHAAAAKALLRGAVLRWHEAGQGAVQYQGAGPFQQSLDTRQPRRAMFQPSEIADLQALCRDTSGSGAYSVDMVGSSSIHAETCSLVFGAAYCSCGTDIAGTPLYGG